MPLVKLIMKYTISETRAYCKLKVITLYDKVWLVNHTYIYYTLILL